MPEIPIILPKFIQDRIDEKRRQEQRPYMECHFPEGLSFESFCDIAESVRKSIKGRKIQLRISGPVIRGDVESRSGLSAWSFKIDYNDYGQITGRYWLYSENNDSVIPEHIARAISSEIQTALEGVTDSESEVETEYYCPNCNADLTKQKGFDPNSHIWTCRGCGELLYDDTVCGDVFGDVIWRCDSCGSILNVQQDFTERLGSWKCTECGFENSITEADIRE